jgi:hypothetical protein
MRRHRRILVLGTAAVLAAAAGGVAALAGGGSGLTPRAYAQQLLSRPGARFMTAQATTAAQILANGGDRFTSSAPVDSSLNAALTAPVTAHANLQMRTAAATPNNVRVNDPSLDQAQVDQTTQSETTIAVSGQHLAIGYNDSQQTLLALTAGSDLSGYSYSNDGGASWTDGGDLPNRPGDINFGDPWMTSSPGGTMYYSTLMFDALQGLLVGVSRSTDGGRTWSTPVSVSPKVGPRGFEFDDKPAITSGPGPGGNGNVLYDTWDGFSCSGRSCVYGVPVSRSTDGGRTWQVSYAAVVPQTKGCSFTQYIGAQPLVNPANGILYVAAEKISAYDPKCNGVPITFSEALFTSTDGGETFAASRISDVTPAFPSGAMTLGPGMLMRTVELPSIAIDGDTLAVVWNDGRLTGHSHILLATRPLSGGSWNLRFITQGTGDEVQPALTSGRGSLHVTYYGRTGSSLNVYEASSEDLATWSVRTITSRSFPGVFTVPQFDPIVAWGYMGDYISSVISGGHQYFAWGDNRDVVTDGLWPNGRHDPDVFFASD